MNVISIKRLKKFYNNKLILDIENLNIKQGEIVVILGKSGCGKSTLLNVLATIDSDVSQDSKIEILGKDIFSLTEKEKTEFRRENMGFIFQFHELIPEFNVIENCTIPLILKGYSKTKAEAIVKEKLKEVDIFDFYKKPNELSGGQQQRVSIIRAILHSPKIIFADEPTGNLDPQTTKQVIELLKKHKSKETTLIIVTHDNFVKSAIGDRIFEFKYNKERGIYLI